MAIKKPKSKKPRLTDESKEFLKRQGLPVVSATYYRKLREICPAFVDGNGFTRSYSDQNAAEFSRVPTYFSFSQFSENFENPFYGNEENLAKIIGRKFGINPEYHFTLLVNEKDSIEFCFSLEFDEIINGKKVPAFHGILVAVGNLDAAREENIAAEVDAVLA